MDDMDRIKLRQLKYNASECNDSKQIETQKKYLNARTQIIISSLDANLCLQMAGGFD
jgi:hypothetical protein